MCGELGAADGWSALGALAAAHAPAPPPAVRAEALGRYGSGWALFPRFVAVELGAVRGVPGSDAYRRGLGARAFHALVLTPAGRLDGHMFVLRPARARAWLAAAAPAEEAHDLLVGFDGAERALWRIRCAR